MPMRSYLLMLTCALPMAACVPGPPPPASQYHTSAATTQLPLVFMPGTIDLTEPEKTELHQLAQTLPIQAVPVLQAAGPLAGERTREVARQLARPVQFAGVSVMPPDQALLIMPSPPIVADACRGPGVRQLGSIWPSNDEDAPILLPPGCATALDIEAQTTQSRDLLQGQPLPPAAATPFAAAIERYYHRNDPQQSTATQGASQGASDQSQSVSTTSAGAAAASPLLGPLPSGQTTQ
jgi:hypothetical protein